MQYPIPLKSGVIGVNCVGISLKPSNGAGYRLPTQFKHTAHTKGLNRVGVGQTHPATPCRPITGAPARA